VTGVEPDRTSNAQHRTPNVQPLLLLNVGRWTFRSAVIGSRGRSPHLPTAYGMHPLPGGGARLRPSRQRCAPLLRTRPASRARRRGWWEARKRPWRSGRYGKEERTTVPANGSAFMNPVLTNSRYPRTAHGRRGSRRNLRGSQGAHAVAPGGSPFQMLTRLADGLGLESGLGGKSSRHRSLASGWIPPLSLR
jgi:hypothetical protein